MVTVVIPVLNESATIGSVVQFAQRSPLVNEVIVVDDGSIDGTPELASAAGARVITSTMLGKGGSMEDGMRLASNEAILYLDGDLRGLADGTVEKMCWPILSDQADFVKAKFTRTAGRVTVLTAKPLLRTYFPELAHLEQPLSGVMAGRKSLLSKLRFENDYGVDIGLLIDAAVAKARIEEVDIGHIEHESHSLEVLGDMATQVARALLERAARAGRLRSSFMEDVREKERADRYELPRFIERVSSAEKLALFDMDGVLLNGRFIHALARETSRENLLAEFLDNFGMKPAERMNRIANVFKGVPRALFDRVAMEIPLMKGARETIVALRKAGYRVGIVTDSYQVVAETVRRRVFADFSLAHLMRFKGGKATGRVTLCPAMIHPEGCTEHDHCKVNVLYHLANRLNLALENILAVGDGENDTCMLRKAGTSFAFQPKSRRVAEAAQRTVRSMSQIPGLLQSQLSRRFSLLSQEPIVAA